MDKEQLWITLGYNIFALEGINGLKIERLAKMAGKNKSSFYHFFVDIHVFTARLLDYHLSVALTIAEKEYTAKNQQQLVSIFVEHKMDLLFNRQLRIHREKEEFEKCFTRINEISIPAIMPVWRKIIGLEEDHYLSEMVFMLSIENFFLQISENTLNEYWLSSYFESIKQMVARFRKI